MKATINGEEFMITQWAPHVVKGLPMGEVTINLQLIDNDGIVFPGSFYSVDRSVTLLEE